jgi:hypothetical protein
LAPKHVFFNVVGQKLTKIKNPQSLCHVESDSTWRDNCLFANQPQTGLLLIAKYLWMGGGGKSCCQKISSLLESFSALYFPENELEKIWLPLKKNKLAGINGPDFLSDHFQITLRSLSMFFDVGKAENIRCNSPYVENILTLSCQRSQTSVVIDVHLGNVLVKLAHQRSHYTAHLRILNQY